MAQRKKFATGFASPMFVLIPFALVGIGMTGWSYYLSIQWTMIQNWEETPATIQTLELKKSQPGRGDGRSSYRVLATYFYEYDGQAFASDRVSLHFGSDNIGSFHKRTYERFKPLVDVPQGAVCFVDPASPADAILVRDARWEMFAFLSMFSCIFGSIGILGALALIHNRRDVRLADSRMKLFPDEPWNWHPRWIDGGVRSEQYDSAKNWIRSAAWWIIATMPTAAFSVLALLQHDYWSLLGLITPICALLMVRGALIRRAHLRDYGAAYLQLSDCPLRSGMETTLAVVFPGGELPDAPVKTKVACYCKVRRGKNMRTETAWKEEHVIETEDCRMISDGLCIAVPVTIPQHSKASTTADDSIVWKMTITVPTKTSPMKVEFRLPVF